MNIQAYSFYKGNIDKRVVELHKAVLSQFDFITMTYIIGDESTSHYEAIDKSIELEQGDRSILWLDIDCLPVSKKELYQFVQDANYGTSLHGNLQRSNHIQNNKHLFVGPSFMLIGKHVLKHIKEVGASAKPTQFGDVAESFSYLVSNQRTHFVPCQSYEKAPLECEKWETNSDYPSFGRFATFGFHKDRPLNFHAFQISHNAELEEYLERGEQILINLNKETL